MEPFSVMVVAGTLAGGIQSFHQQDQQLHKIPEDLFSVNARLYHSEAGLIGLNFI
jgi:hypothetical protein